MATVHPSAAVGNDVELADDVEVGPYCVIDGKVKLGAGTRLMHRVSLQGPLTMGEGNLVYPGATLGFAPQDLKFDPATGGAGLVIGDHNVIREGVSIHRATKDRPTTVGSHNYVMVNSHFGHDCRIGDHCMFANGVLLAGHVTVEDRVVMGGAAVAHQFVTIGRLCMVSGLSGMGLDMPPFCTLYVSRYVGSLNIVGLRRAGYRDSIPALKRAFDMLYRQRRANKSAVTEIERHPELMADPLVQEFVAFVRNSRRGICQYRGRHSKTDPDDND